MKTRRDLLCDRAMEYVLTRKVEDLGDLTVAKIAKALKVSRSYLARTFKSERDFSIKEYLFREKMLRSALLLMNKPQLTIRQISEMIGFLDANYFAHIFKKYFGISPGKYRDSKKV